MLAEVLDFWERDADDECWEAIYEIVFLGLGIADLVVAVKSEGCTVVPDLKPFLLIWSSVDILSSCLTLVSIAVAMKSRTGGEGSGGDRGKCGKLMDATSFVAHLAIVGITAWGSFLVFSPSGRKASGPCGTLYYLAYVSIIFTWIYVALILYTTFKKFREGRGDSSGGSGRGGDAPANMEPLL